ncbi:MAG: choline BCCT transporter BetT [Cellvibrionales bacterium]|nr:choline BCCT transporter BetT [Cellvibrionales bacterium]
MQFKHALNPPVFFSATVLIAILSGFAVVDPKSMGLFFNHLQDKLTLNFGWFYVLSVALILICIVFLAMSRYGDIKLGRDHSEPEFSFKSWFAMLFSAGMGIGLVFFGVSEPVMHFVSPPVGQPETLDAAREAMKITFFHWGFHAWAIYALVAMILAFFSFRHDLPLTLRSALYPIIGERIYGIAGHLVDIFAIIGTVFGVATSLGFGVLQVNSGLNYLYQVPVNVSVQILLILLTSLLATISVASGLEKGIRLLSELNLFLALCFMLFVMILGPTPMLLPMFVQNTGAYLSDIVSKTFNLYAYDANNWIGGWTIFYWAFWLSWSPFVGMFIARISHGRTIREFVLGVLFVPSLLTFLWMTTFGNTAIDLILHHGNTALSDVVQQDTSLALFQFLTSFPLANVLSILAIVIIVIFFVTSCDSSAMVIDILSSKPSNTSQSQVVAGPLWQRIFWSLSIGIVAMVLMLAGGLKALQAATIVSALPFCIILLFSTYGLLRGLMTDSLKKESLEHIHITPPQSAKGAIPWQSRLSNLVHFPRQKQVKTFNANVVYPAMLAIAEELEKQGVKTALTQDETNDSPCLTIIHGDEKNFIYKITPRAYLQPSFMMDDSDDEHRKYYRAEVFLSEGGQNYDIMGWSKEQVINDIIRQYEKHMHFLHVIR